MTRLKGIIIILIIYFVFYLSITLDLNILYPYYYLKDLLMYPVYAITNDNDIKLSKDLSEGINESIQEDIDELKKLTDIKITLSDFQNVNATVISRNREYWFNTLTIDKGSSDGLKDNLAVIDSNGLIGRIEKTRNHSSDIKLITSNDINNKISVVIKSDNKDIYGITTGYDYDNNYLNVTMFNHETIKNGSMVYTTGMGGVFPKGILIGKVDYTKKDNDEVSLIAKVSLSSNIEGDKYVSVLKREEISNN